ncbi:MAG: LysR family transcriptional regulator, partial [Oscillospiraceae bacterium]
AKQLYLSAPALSLYISNLESTLGVQLFERVGKRFLLTYMGEMYVQKARQMLDLKTSFDLELASYRKGYKERLRVAMQDIRSQHLSPKLIQAFYATYPEVDLIWYEGNYNQLEEM